MLTAKEIINLACCGSASSSPPHCPIRPVVLRTFLTHGADDASENTHTALVTNRNGMFLASVSHHQVPSSHPEKALPPLGVAPLLSGKKPSQRYRRAVYDVDHWEDVDNLDNIVDGRHHVVFLDVRGVGGKYGGNGLDYWKQAELSRRLTGRKARGSTSGGQVHSLRSSSATQRSWIDWKFRT